jgi:hypothetical protein
MENVNGFEGHLLETRLVVSAASTLGSDGKVEGVLVDVLVQPSRDVAAGEETESTLSVVKRLKLGVVVSDLVPVRCPSLELRNVAIARTSEEVFRTSTKEEVDTLPGEPGKVAGHTVEVLLDDCGVLGSLRRVRADGGRSGVGNVGR